MVPHLQMHQGLAKQGLLHGGGHHVAGLQYKGGGGTVANTKLYGTVPNRSPAFMSTKGQVLVTHEVVALAPALPRPHATAAQCAFHQQAQL